MGSVSNFIEEHFDTEVTLALAICGAFWGMFKRGENQEREHLKEWLKRIEDDIKEIDAEVKLISNSVASVEMVKELNEDISELQKAINIARERAVSIERVARLSDEFQGLREIIQKTREQMLQVATKERADITKINESLLRIERTIATKVDKTSCKLIHNQMIQTVEKHDKTRA